MLGKINISDCLNDWVSKCDVILYSGYKDGTETLPCTYVWWPVDTDQRPMWSKSKQKFNVVLDLSGSRQAGMAMENESISFSVSSERNAYYVLLAIDPTGTINVIYPESTSQIRSVDAGEIIRIPEKKGPNSARIQPPFGREYVVLVAFERPPDGLAEIIGAKIDASSPKLSVLKSLLDVNKTSLAHAVLQLETIRYTNRAPVYR